jgi:protoporphyrinogen/coproporphyrinogen III oxidase
MNHVVVVGSGLAGLSAGYRLHERGWRVTVLESLGRVGGRVWSQADDGFLFDLGPTIVTDNYREYMKLVDDVGLSGEVVDCPPEVAIAKGDELHVFDTGRPLRSFVTTKLIPPAAKLRLLARGVRLIKPMYGINPYDLSNRVQYDTESIQTYLDRVFGRELNELVIDGLTRSMVSSVPGESSVVGFFAGAGTASGKMQALKGGLQRLPARLAEQLDVRLNAPVTAVRRSGDGVQVQYQDGSGASIQEEADACVIATPFRDAANMYPPLKEPGADLLDATADSGCYSAQLTYTRRPDKEPFLVMVPKPTSAEIGSLFLEHVKAPDRAPAGTALITAFFPLHPGVDTDAWGDDRLIATARELIERLFPELGGHFLTARITRWPYAANRADVGYYRALQKFVDNHPADDPVQVAGDYLALPSQESAVAAGVKAAERILAAQAGGR